MENYLKHLMEDMDALLRAPRYMEKPPLPPFTPEERAYLRGERPAELEEEGDADQGEVADWEDMLAADDAAFLHSVYEGGLDAFEDLEALDASEEDPNPFLGRPVDRGPQDPRSFASFCGLDLAAFPDDRLMTEAQVSTLVEKMAALFSYYNLEPIFREHLPVRRSYGLLLHCLKIPQPIMTFGTLYLDLCSGDERNCIHEEFCACAKKRAEAAAEDAVSDQRKAASDEDDFPDQLAS